MNQAESIQQSTEQKKVVALHCRAVLSRHAKSFRWASFFLSPQQCTNAAIAYAYCRSVDDAVDEAFDEATALQGLREQEDMLSGASPPDATTTAYLVLAEEAGFGLLPAQDLLAGARSDLGPVFMEHDTELLTYCYRVAGTVGLMMCGILKVSETQAQRHAIDLGIAMQITNICRDVLEDAVRGRVYLPRSRLGKVGLSPDDIINFARSSVQLSPADVESLETGVASVVSDLLLLAEEKYESGQLGYPALPLRARLSVMVAADLYRAIGRRLLSAWGSNSLRGRMTVSPIRKAALTLRASCVWLLTLLPSGLDRTTPSVTE